MTEFDYEGTYYLTEGLINIWWNPKLSSRDQFGYDPPVLLPEVTAWLDAHEGTAWQPHTLVGPPQWVFPTAELRTEFVELFLETEERMREIIDAGVAANEAADAKLWYEQGRPRKDGRAYVTKTIRKYFNRDELVEVQALIRDPETGKSVLER